MSNKVELTDDQARGLVYLLCLPLILFGIFFQPFVLMKLWNWHVATIGIIEISYLKAFALILVFRCFKGLSVQVGATEDEKMEATFKLGKTFVWFWPSVLFIGWLLSCD